MGKKKVIALLMAAIMTTTVMAGCGSEDTLQPDAEVKQAKMYKLTLYKRLLYKLTPHKRKMKKNRKKIK